MLNFTNRSSFRRSIFILRLSIFVLTKDTTYVFFLLKLSAARVFAFLSGPPDFGAGQLDTRRYGEQYASKGEDADRALLPEQTPFYKDLVLGFAPLLVLLVYVSDMEV